jgi:hypothetical protein
MEPPEQARKYQAMFDRLFPHGCIVTSADSPQAHTLPVPRPEVVRLRGIDPVVFFDSPSEGRSFSGAVTACALVQEQPCALLKLTLDLGGETPAHRYMDMVCSGNVSPAQAKALAKDRQESLRLSAEGRVFRGDEEDG